MSEAVATVSPSVAEVEVQPAVASGLQLLGGVGAVCEGDFCEIPDHHEQAVVNRRLDEDAV
ncbi:hypothetical protein HDC94_002089 [Leifsonia sp. AK011]|uniref:hypothetical protein n=1 Tax=Leifsonia sp. AK011 TaxID=2723075 RepID=UPI0015CE0E73|nr:hypothetical protein [Leifsonia sp. AK011]NYF10933.1 hypothetical protein [Leifsonia sp. AK011]